MKKQRGTDRSSGQTISGPITKDEEEVVETLYALAGMFPNDVASDKSKLDSEYLETDPSALPEPKETHTPVLEGLFLQFLSGNLRFFYDSFYCSLLSF